MNISPITAAVLLSIVLISGCSGHNMNSQSANDRTPIDGSVQNLPITSVKAEGTTSENIQPIQLEKLETYRNGKVEPLQSGNIIKRDTEFIILTFNHGISTFSDFITVTDSTGKTVQWNYVGRAWPPNQKLNQYAVNVNGPLSRNESYTLKLMGELIDTNNKRVTIDQAVTVKTQDIAIERSFTMNLFAQKTQPSAVDTIRLIAKADTKRIHVTPLHVAQGNDLRFLLVDSAKKTIFYQSDSSANLAFDIDIPHPGNFDLLAVYRMNDYVTSEVERAPVQMTVSDQELSIPDSAIPTLQFANTDSPTIVTGEMNFSLDTEPNAKVGVLVDGIPSKGSWGHSTGWGKYALFVKVDTLKDGPHTISIFSSAPNSVNQRMINREILLNRKDSFTDVPQSHWAYDDIERLHGLGILEGRSEGSFQPDELVTRQEFLKMLVMAAKPEAKQPSLSFVDVSGEMWSKQYINIGSSSGLVDGEVVSGKRMFYPTRTISRLETVAMMARTARLSSLPQPMTAIPLFEDRAAIQPWGVPYVEKLNYYHWIEGYQDRTFRPDKPLTRAEASTLLASFTHDANFPLNDGLTGYLHFDQQWLY